jgi:hypothetical protein
MNIIRVIGGLIAFGVAGVLAFRLVLVLPVVLPTFRQLGQEPTTFFVHHIWGWSLVGWQIILFELAVAAVCLLSACFGVYALSGTKNTG